MTTAIFGILRAPDTNMYSQWGDAIIRMHFSPSAFFSEPVRPFPLFSVGFATLVAVLKVCLGAGWPYGLIALNTLAAGLTAAMLADLVISATSSRTAQAIAVLFYLTSFDTANLTRFVLTDATSATLTFAVFYLLARPFLDDRAPQRWRYWGAAAAALALALVWRPTAVALLMAPVASAVAWRARDRSRFPIAPRRVALLAVSAIAAIVVIHAAFMRQPDAWPSWLPGGAYIQSIADRYRYGIVVELKINHPAPGDSLAAHVGITLHKLAAFFYFLTPTYSWLHNVMNITYYLPLYALAVAGIVGRRGTAGDVARSARPVIWIAVVSVASLALFHALTLVDFDWRYRIAVLPHLIVLAAIGAGSAIRSTIVNTSRQGHSPCV